MGDSWRERERERVCLVVFDIVGMVKRLSSGERKIESKWG